MFTRNNEKLVGLPTTIKEFSNGVDVDLHKCAKSTLVRGELSQTSSIKLDTNATINELD